MLKKEEETSDFLLKYYEDLKLVMKYSNLSKICKIKDLPNEAINI